MEVIREKHDVPALAAAAVDEGSIVALGVSGRRNAKSVIPVTTDDQWEIGSCTKSMTASVAAMLVEDGSIGWESTIADIFPELIPTMDAEWRSVRLDQLLMHLGGAPHKPPADLWAEARLQHGTPMEQRSKFVHGLLQREPPHTPGRRSVYSDCGYAIAGAMMERVAGESWEELLRHRLFEPLGLTTAGFGPPASPGEINQPWGHHGDEPPYEPVPPNDEKDVPPAIGPAGTVHCSIGDFVRYAAWHVAGARGDGTLLQPESFAKLHTAPSGLQYAFGWVVTKRRWADGIALMHNGETITFYAVIWLAPNENTAFVAATNADNPDAGAACDEAIRMLINRF